MKPREDNIAVFREALAFVLKWEGGWSDHPNDAGGATMRGITIGRYAEYKGRAVTKAELAAITEAEIEDIYLRHYWVPAKCDWIVENLGGALAILVFNCAVNSGPGRSTQFLNELMQLGANGMRWTPQLEAALVKYCTDDHRGYRMLKRRFIQRYYVFYASIVRTNRSQGDFILGWINRNNDTLNFL